MNAAITLKDLSTLSGFSVSTISKALNDKVDISAKTRQRIRSIAKEYNYVPNTYAVGLRKKKTKVIAVILPQVNKSFYSSFLYSIQKKASNYGYRLFLFQSFEEDAKEREYLNSINDGSVDGAIVLSLNKKENKQLENAIFPIEHVELSEEKREDVLKQYCLNKFNSLLKKI